MTKQKENRKIDIKFILKGKDGKPKNSIGLLDSRLFTGENSLRAVMDTQTCLWYLRYDHGILPEELRNKYTSYSMALKHVTEYMKKRNIEIVEILD